MGFKRLLFFVIAFGISLALFACNTLEDEVTVTSISVQEEDIEGDFLLGEFELSNVRLVVTYEDGSKELVNLTESMISDQDIDKFNQVGTHTIVVTYDALKTTFILSIIEELDGLTMTLMSIHQLGTEQGAITESYEEWLESVRGPRGETGEDGREVYFQVGDGFIQWRYEGEDEWENLIAINSLVGHQGEPGQDGKDGREAVFQFSDGYIQWRYDDYEDWIKLVDLETLIDMDILVPYIGENGTWWVREYDTGVIAQPKPVTDYSTNGLSYALTTLDGDIGYYVTNYTGVESEVFIPNVINGMPVLSIGNDAFRNSFIDVVHIPNNIKTIESRAFHNITDGLIVHLNEHSNLQYIGDNAFENTEINNRLVLPNTLVHIGREAFVNSFYKHSLIIPTSVEYIGFEALYSIRTNHAPIYLEVSEDLEDWNEQWTNRRDYELHYSISSYDGYIYNDIDENSVRIVGYQGNDTEIEIPKYIDGKSVLEIGSHAFLYNDSIVGIQISNKLETLERMALLYMTSLRYVVIPENVENIAEDSMYYLPTDYESHHDEAIFISLYFEMEMPEQCMYYFCEGQGLFVHWGVDPSSVRVYDNLQYIVENDKAFISGTMYKDSKLVVPQVIEGYEVTKVLNASLSFTKFEEILLPEGLKQIGALAFYFTTLETQSIPSTVTTIDRYAFAGSSIGYIHVPMSVAHIGEYAFNTSNWDAVILVERNSRPVGWDSTWSHDKIVYWGVSDFIFEDDYLFALNSDNTARLLKYFGNDDLIFIPSDVDGYVVDTIQSMAISTSRNDAKISIPSSIIYIDYHGIHTTSNSARIYIEHESLPATWDSQWYFRGNTYLNSTLD